MLAGKTGKVSAWTLAILLACGTGLGFAGDLAGTAWQITGVSKEKVRKVGHQKDSLTGMTLVFQDGGTCYVHIEEDAADLPCTWEAGRKGRRFTVTLDEEAAEDLVVSAWDDLVGGSIDDGSIDQNRGRGRVNRKMTRLKLKFVVKATVSGHDSQGHAMENQRVKIRVKMKGTPATTF